MLGLICSGRCQEALGFVEAVWPEGKAGKEDIIRDVAEQVVASWYEERLPWIGDLKKVVDEIYPCPLNRVQVARSGSKRYAAIH